MNISIIYREQGRDELSDIRHSHDNEIELIHVISGKGKVFVGDDVLSFDGSAVFFIDGAILHYICPNSDIPYIRSKLILKKDIMGDMLSSYIKNGCLHQIPSNELSFEIDRAFFELFESHNNGDAELMLCSKIFELLHLCIERADENGVKYRGAVADVVSYIHKHLEDGIALSNVAQALHINKNYLCRLFRKETGMTVGAYINSARIAKAKRLLRDSDSPLSFVAGESGFNEPSVFSKNFKREVGMTPREYRNAMKNKSF